MSMKKGLGDVMNLILSLIPLFVVALGSDLSSLLIFTKDISPADATWTLSTPACQWKHIECANEVVVSIFLTDFGFYGVPNFTSLPSHLEQLHLSNAMKKKMREDQSVGPRWGKTVGAHGFSGNPNFSNLPPSLEILDLSGNQFSGSLPVIGFNAKNSSGNLRQLFLHYNMFSGSAELFLQQLPITMEVSTFFGNDLSGNIEYIFSTLAAPNLTQLDLAWNNFTGFIELASLSRCCPILSVLNLYGNHFEGPLNLQHLPASLHFLALEDNAGICGSGSIVPQTVCGAVYLGKPCVVDCNSSSYWCPDC